MSDESSKDALQAFGVIPNVYFDLIARVIPGCLFLFTIDRVTPRHAVSAITDVFIPPKLAESTTPWMLVIISAGYILGHAFSPIVRFLERRPKWIKDNNILKNMFPFWRSEEATSEKATELGVAYNKLRRQKPALSALAIRIRAEYTMYGGFAVAIAITLLVAFLRMSVGLIHHTFHLTMDWGNWLILIIAVLSVPIMLQRHLDTWRRFRDTVEELNKED
jgi:hypothetical protein